MVLSHHRLANSNLESTTRHFLPTRGRILQISPCFLSWFPLENKKPTLKIFCCLSGWERRGEREKWRELLWTQAEINNTVFSHKILGDKMCKIQSINLVRLEKIVVFYIFQFYAFFFLLIILLSAWKFGEKLNEHEFEHFLEFLLL